MGSWEREDEQGATCLRLIGGPHRGGRRRLGNCPARAQAVGASEPLGLLGRAPAERPKAGEVFAGHTGGGKEKRLGHGMGGKWRLGRGEGNWPDRGWRVFYIFFLF